MLNSSAEWFGHLAVQLAAVVSFEACLQTATAECLRLPMEPPWSVADGTRADRPSRTTRASATASSATPAVNELPKPAVENLLNKLPQPPRMTSGALLAGNFSPSGYRIAPHETRHASALKPVGDRIQALPLKGPADETDPYIVKQATVLNKDPQQIFAFVRDNIGYEAYSGSLRGARGTLWSKAGNSLDRASLLVALLRASGFQARYAQGTLARPQAQALILSMFAGRYRFLGCLPPGTATADPANDATLLGIAQNHYWAEYSPSGSGFTDADASFPSAQLGQTFTTPSGTFSDVPANLQHTVAFTLQAETYSQAGAAFGLSGNGLSTTTVLQQSFATASLVGKPVTAGVFVSTSGTGFLLTAQTNTYSPYLLIGQDPSNPDSDDVIRGTDFQEVLTNFPLGSQIITGLFLTATVTDASGNSQTYNKTIYDAIGPAGRAGTSQVKLGSGTKPSLSRLDVTTINVLPSLQDPSIVTLWSAVNDSLTSQLKSLTAQLPSTPGTPLTTQQIAINKQATAVAAKIATNSQRILTAAFASASDRSSAALAQNAVVSEYPSSPRLIAATEFQKNNPDNTSVLQIGFDLIKDDVQVLPLPAQSLAAAYGYRMQRGVLESYIESLVLKAFTAAQTPSKNASVTVAVSATDIITAARNQGVSVVTIQQSNVDQLAGLNISADAKARIAQSVAAGNIIEAPSQAVMVGGVQRIGWFEFQPDGTTQGVLENGDRGAITEYSAVQIAVTALEEGEEAAIEFFTGFLLGWGAGMLVVFEGALISGVKVSVSAEQVLSDTIQMLLNSLIEQFLATAPFNPVFQAGFRLGVAYAERAALAYSLIDPPLPAGLLAGSTPPRLTPTSSPGAAITIAPDTRLTVPLGNSLLVNGNAQLPTVFDTQIKNSGPTADTFNISLVNPPPGFTLVGSMPTLTIPGGGQAEISVCAVPTGTLPAPGTPESFSVAATSASNPSVTATANTSFNVPPVVGVTLITIASPATVTPGNSAPVQLQIVGAGNVPTAATLNVQSDANLTVTGLQSTVNVNPGQTITQNLTLTPTSSAPIGRSLGATITAIYGASQTTQTQIAVTVEAVQAQSSATASNAAATLGRGDIATTLSGLSGAINSVTATCNANSQAQVLAYVNNLIAEMNAPFLANFTSDLQNARSAISASNCNNIGTALTALSGVVSNISTVLQSPAAYPFDFMLSPNSAVAQPNQTSTLTVVLRNTSTSTNTYTLALGSVPAGVTANLNTTSVTLGPGASIAPGSATVTVTPTAATAAAIDLTASINGIANSARTIEATLTARSEFIKIQDVTPSNANVQAGTPVDVVVRVANEVNQPRTVQANLILKDSGGNTVATPAPQTAALSVQNSLTSITIAQVSTTGLPNGYFTLSVTLVDPQTGQPIPGGSGSGTLLIGSPVKASFTVTPQTVPPGNSQVFTSLNLSTLSGGTQGGAPYSLLAQVNTPSAAQSVAINGNLLYVCDNSEVLVYDVSNPSSPVKLSTALAGTINNSGNINCEVRNGKLLAVADTTSSTLGNNASFVAFDLTNPQQPSLVADTAINKRFMQQPLYIGNTAFIPTNAIYFYGNQRPFQELGDLVSLDVTNVAAPAIVGTLEKTSPDPVYGGSTPIFQGSAADPQTVYLGATSTAGTNIDNGNGQVWVVDVTNPAATSILKKIDIAGTIQTTAPIIQGNVAVAQSNTGGWNVVAANTPGTRGNIVFTVLDITNHRSPAITGTITTTLVPGTGGGSGAIGPNLFLFGGVRDASNKPVLAVVDTTDPARPVLTTYPVAFEPTRFRIVGNVLYATSGTNGLTIYSIPGTGSITYTAHVKIPNTGKLIYNPNSFNIQPTSIVPAASYDLVTWQNPASTTLSWTSTITGIVPGEVIAAALDSTVDYSVAQGSGTSAVSGVNVNSAQILGLNPANQTVTPGQQATYSLALSNPTGSTVTYNLAVIGVPQSWVTLPPTIAVAPNTTATLSLLLRSAIADIAGTYGFTVTATSGGTSGSVSGTLVLQGTGTVGTAIPNPGGVAVVLSPAQQTTGQGMTANYLVQLTPVGTPASSYTLTAQAPAGVTATFDQTTLPFAAGSPNIPQTVLHLTVAKGTAPAALSFAVTAAESSNQALTGQAAGTLNVVSSGVTLAFSSASASPNSTLQLQVTNTGTAGDTFNLTLGAPAGLASTLAKTSVTLAPGQSQNVGVNVGAMSFATLGNVLLTAQVTPQSNPAIAAQASAQVVIPATQGVAASFAPAVQATATPGAVPFLLKVQNTGTIEDAYIATIIATTGSVQASFADASGNLVQTTSLFRIPGVSAGTLLLNTMSTASSGGTVTVKITSQTNPSVAASAVATVRIGALGGPVANAGKNQSVAAGKYVLLDGCASYDPAGGRLSYRWALLSSPGGSAATLANSTAPSPALLPDVAGRYQLQLVVNNGTADSTPATVTVTAISNGNIPPTADAGPAKNALTGSPVTLDGNGSFDPDNGPQPLTYAWKFAQVPQGSTRSGNLVSTGATASFTPDVSGAFIITLTVSDGSATSSDSVTVTASASNVAPNANAGRTRRVLVNSPVALDASASNDPDNGPQPLTYAWQLVSGPLNSSVIQNPSAQKTTFTPATAAQYVARVDVSDGQASSEAQVGIIAGNTCDGNGDGVVNQIDFDLITALFGRAALPNDPLDANGDGVIDGRDLSICSSQLKPEVPTIFVDPPAVNFVFQKGRPLPAGQTVNVTGDSFTSFVIANLFNSQWLTWTVNNPATHAKVTISVSPAGLAAGVYDGQLAFGGPSINAAVLKIRLTVYDPSVLVALPSSLTFTAQSGAAEPLEQLLYVTAQGKQVGAASAVPSATWLEVEPNLGPTPINFRVLAHPGQLAPGSYTATITISADSTSPLIVPVTLIVL